MDIIVDSSIHLNPSDLPESVLGEIYSALTIPNPRKKRAEREMLWGAKDLPDNIELWDCDVSNNLIIPRGFLTKLDQILIKNGISSNFVDKSVIGKNKLFKDIDPIKLRDYQQRGSFKLCMASQGIYKAPTGSGKTRTMLEVIRQAGQKTLVICEKKDIQYQWIQSAEELEFGRIGCIDDQCWAVGYDIIICLRQSLWSRIDSLGRTNWFNKFGMIIVDECHHCTADTMVDLVQRFPAYYRFGCSATPDADPDLFPIAQAVLGPVVAESTPEEIGDHLVIPSVRVVKTEFEFPYRPTQAVEISQDKITVARNNYLQMMIALQSNKQRNRLIMREVYKESMSGHKCLVASKRKLQFRDLYEIMNIEYPELNLISYELTGDNSSEYNDIKKKIEDSNKGTILFSTLADEGTDIPCLDRLFLAYPGRKLRGFEQSIGRIMRPHPGKKDAIVYDFRDAQVPILNSQFRNRCQNIYHKKGYTVDTLV